MSDYTSSIKHIADDLYYVSLTPLSDNFKKMFDNHIENEFSIQTYYQRAVEAKLGSNMEIAAWRETSKLPYSAIVIIQNTSGIGGI